MKFPDTLDLNMAWHDQIRAKAKAYYYAWKRAHRMRRSIAVVECAFHSPLYLRAQCAPYYSIFRRNYDTRIP